MNRIREKGAEIRRFLAAELNTERNWDLRCNEGLESVFHPWLKLRSFHEAKKVGIDFQRLTCSHPSPLIPLPVEGRGSRDRQIVINPSYSGIAATACRGLPVMLL
jgi:hypothetical protein